MLFKRLKFNEALLRQGGWKEPQNRGMLMTGRTIGIIGVGRIGRNVVKRLSGWDLKFLGYDPYVDQEAVAPLGIKMVSLEELLETIGSGDDSCGSHPGDAQDDPVSAAQDDEEDRVHRQHFRGQVFDEADLAQALNEGIIAGAALDVFDEEPTPMNNPLRQVDPTKLTMTPHIIGNNPGSLEAGQRLAAQQHSFDSRRQAA